MTTRTSTVEDPSEQEKEVEARSLSSGSTLSRRRRPSSNPWAGKSLKELSSHRPPIPHVITSGMGALYADWGNDSARDTQIDPSIYDQDFDDISDAGSDFTDDYSRYRYLGEQKKGEARTIESGTNEDNDSLSSNESSRLVDFDDDDWSQSSLSTAASAMASRRIPGEIWSVQDKVLQQNEVLMLNVEEAPASDSNSESLQVVESGSLSSHSQSVAYSGRANRGAHRTADSRHRHPMKQSSLRSIESMPPEAICFSKDSSNTSDDELSIDSNVFGKSEGTQSDGSQRQTLIRQKIDFQKDSSLKPLSDDVLGTSVIDTDSQDGPMGAVIASETTSTRNKAQDKAQRKRRKSSTSETPIIKADTSVIGRSRPQPRRSKSTYSLPSAERKKLSAGKATSRKKEEEKNPIVPTPKEIIDRIPQIEDTFTHSSHQKNLGNLEFLADFTRVYVSSIELRCPLKDKSQRRNKKNPRSRKKKSRRKSLSDTVSSGNTTTASEGSTDTTEKSRDSQKKSHPAPKKKSKKGKSRMRGKRAHFEEVQCIQMEDEAETRSVEKSIEAIFSNVDMGFSNHSTNTGTSFHLQIDTTRPTKVKCKASRAKTKESSRARKLRRSLSSSAALEPKKTVRNARSKSREAMQPKVKTSQTENRQNSEVPRKRSKSIDVADLELRGEKKVENEKNKDFTASFLPLSTGLLLGDILDGEKEEMGLSLERRELSEVATRGASQQGQCLARPKNIIDSEFPGHDIEQLKANILFVEEQLLSVQARTTEDLDLMQREANIEKEEIAAKILAEQRSKSPIDAILLLHKTMVNDLHTSSRELKKQIKALQVGLSTEVSILTKLTKQAQEFRERTASVETLISRCEGEILFNVKELDQCKREVNEILIHSGGQHNGQNSRIFRQFEDLTQAVQVPLFQKWDDPCRPVTRQAFDSALTASYELPKTSIFHDVLNDPDHKLMFTR